MPPFPLRYIAFTSLFVGLVTVLAVVKLIHRVDQNPQATLATANLASYSTSTLVDGSQLSFSYPRTWGRVMQASVPENEAAGPDRTPRRHTISFSDLPRGRNCPGPLELAIYDAAGLSKPSFADIATQARIARQLAGGQRPAPSASGPRLLPLLATLRWPTLMTSFHAQGGTLRGIRYVANPIQGLEPGIFYESILHSDDGAVFVEVSGELDCGIIDRVRDNLEKTGVNPMHLEDTMRQLLSNVPSHPVLGPQLRELDTFVTSIRLEK